VQKLSVTICDETSEATLSTSGLLTTSAREWEQHKTILLISSPAKLPGGKLDIRARTVVEIDPNIGEAKSLRRWIRRENCPLNEQFPSHLFNMVHIHQSCTRLQFTLSTLNSRIRASPSQKHTGYLSVILTQLHLISLWTRHQLFSMECSCGHPIYANTRRSSCPQCSTQNITLRLNPNLIAEMADETGAISSVVPGADATTPFSSSKSTTVLTRQQPQQQLRPQQRSKLLWTDQAWTQLLGREPDHIAALANVNTTTDPARAQRNLLFLQHLEQRLAFMRVILLVAWTGEQLGGRLAVLEVVG
jgi:hypothetical protein